jgi:hypothetical protein
MKHFLSTLILFLSVSAFAQTDTLHLNYHHSQTTLQDTAIKKIDAWVAKLNNQHHDIKVFAYFSKPEYEKFAQQRADELFLLLNRKARALLTIEFIGPKKGKNWQRSMVDIIYTNPAKELEAKAKAEAAAKAKAEEQAKAKAEADAKQKAAKEKKGEESAAGAKKTDKKEGAATAKDDKGKKDGKETENKATALDKDSKESKSDEEPEDTGDSKNYPGKRTGGVGMGASDDDVAMIKKANIIVAITHSSKIDTILHRAVRKFWTFNPNITYMPYSEAKELAKKDKNTLIMFTTVLNSKSVTHSSGRYSTSWSRGLVLEKGKGKVVLANFFPPMGDDNGVREEAVAFAVSAMNSLLVNMEEQKISKMWRMNAPFKKNSAGLKERTLLIPRDWLSKKAKEEGVQKYYHAKIEAVDYSTYRDAILNKQPYAYVMPVPFSVGGQLRYYDYLMDAETGAVYYIHEPPIMGGPSLTNPLTGSVYDLTRSERISAKNLEKYNKAFEKKDDKESEGENISDVKEEETGEKKEGDAKPAGKEEKKSKEKKEEEAGDKKEGDVKPAKEAKKKKEKKEDKEVEKKEEKTDEKSEEKKEETKQD